MLMDKPCKAPCRISSPAEAKQEDIIPFRIVLQDEIIAIENIFQNAVPSDTAPYPVPEAPVPTPKS